MSKSGKDIAEDIRSAIRQAVNSETAPTAEGHFYLIAKKFIPREKLHERKIKFKSFAEARIWISENGSEKTLRAYRCDLCDGYHMATKGKA